MARLKRGTRECMKMARVDEHERERVGIVCYVRICLLRPLFGKGSFENNGVVPFEALPA